jgi:hypothetical protein
MARVRSLQLALRAGGATEVLDVGDDRVLAVSRRHRRSGRLLAMATFSDGEVRLDRQRAALGFTARARTVLASPGAEVADEQVVLPAWSYVWLAED